MIRRAKTQTTKKPLHRANPQPEKLPLIEHLHELRRRLFYVAVSIGIGGLAAYGVERKLIDLLLRPSHGQDFIYTSPLGGMNFLFGLCLYVGIIVSTPVIFYQLLAFLRPLMKHATRRLLLTASAVAGAVALAGVLFGYFIGLPSALHFLLNQFVTVQVRPLITVQSYLSFVGLYLVGSALMFQLPLIIFFINRIKPLKPSTLFKYERHLILFALIIAFIMNPTPNLLSQMVIVIPIIVMYQFSIAMVWFINRGGRRHKYLQLLKQDALLQAKRLEQAATSRPLFTSSLLSPQSATSTSAVPLVSPFEQAAIEPEPVQRPLRGGYGPYTRSNYHRSDYSHLVQ